MRALLLSFLMSFSFMPVAAQRGLQLGISSGISGLIGDVSTHRTYKPMVGMSGRYFPHTRFGFDLSLIQTWAKGDDSDAFSSRMKIRNLSFRTPITEGTANLIYYLSPEFNKLEYFASIGIGLFAFNPQAKLDDSWYDLQPLGTEGQHLPDCSGCPKPYSLIQPMIPFAIGLKVATKYKLTYEFALNYRFTFTDYIDDVGPRYADSEEIGNWMGTTARILSDRRDLSRFAPAVAGERRGNGFWDSYFFLRVSLFYHLQYNSFGID